MKKKILLMGSSFACALGIVLVILTLTFAMCGAALASPETTKPGDGCAKKTSTGDCGANDCSTDTPNCHVKKNDTCGCAK